MTRPILDSHFPKWSTRATTDEAATAQSRRDGDVAFPVDVGKRKARVGSVGWKLGARRWWWCLLALRSGVGNREKRTMGQWVDSHQMDEAALVVACRWTQNVAAQGCWLCLSGHCPVASEPTVPVMECIKSGLWTFGVSGKGKHGSKKKK